jgi:hypothetical protein
MKVVSPRLVLWRCLAISVVAATPVAAQKAAPARSAAPPAASTLAPVNQPVNQPAAVAPGNALPRLGQRIDPIVPPVQRVAPPLQTASPLVPAVKRTKASLATLKRQAAAAAKAAASAPPAAAPPAEATQAGVQSVGPAPATIAKKTGKPSPLAPEKRSALGRVTNQAQTVKPARPALARLATATRSTITRVKTTAKSLARPKTR